MIIIIIVCNYILDGQRFSDFLSVEMKQKPGDLTWLNMRKGIKWVHSLGELDQILFRGLTARIPTASSE